MLQYCEGAGIRVMGYSPLGSSADRSPEAHGTTLLNHPGVKAIADATGEFHAGRAAIAPHPARKPSRQTSLWR